MVLKKGICTFAFPSSMSLSEIFFEAKKYGFDGVELCMTLDGPLTPDISDEELCRIKADATSAGIELYSVMTSVYWSASLVSDDESQRELAKSYAKKQIDIAKKLGCETVLIVPGHTGVDFAPDLGVVDYETAYNRAVEAAKELAPYAQDAGVVMGMENVWNKFLLSPLEMRNFIDEIDNPYVMAYLDVGNILVNGYPEHWVKILGKRISKVHIKDFKMSIGNITGFCDLLSGDVNFPAVTEALRSVGYDGWITAETGAYKSNNQVMIEHISSAMNYILKEI